LVLPTKSMFKH